MSALGIAILICLALAGPLWSATQIAYAFAVAHLPKVPSPKGLLTTEIKLPLWKAVLYLSAFWMIVSGGGVGIPSWKLAEWKLPGWLTVVAPAKVTTVTYFYEKDSGGVPPFVGTALSKLNARDIIATTHEDDGTNAAGAIPAQHKISLPAARSVGLPAVVASAGDKVLKVVSKPESEEQVLGVAP